MQAIMMAAGRGSRLGGLTADKPKSFIEIKGKRLIDYNLLLLREYRVNEIIIVTGYQCEMFEELAKKSSDIRLIYNPFYEFVNVLGSFYMGMEALHDDFLYLHADTLCEPAIFEKLLHTPADVVLPIDYKKCDEEAMKVRSENGRLVEITKQMPLNIAEGEFIGIAAFRKSVILDLKRIVRKLLQEREFAAYFESALQRILDEKRFDVQSVATDGAFWTEIDFPDDYNRAITEIPKCLTELFG